MGLSPVFNQSVFFLINLFSLEEMSKEKVTKGDQQLELSTSGQSAMPKGRNTLTIWGRGIISSKMPK